MAVQIREGESFDRALERFKKQCAKDGVFSEMRKREYYQSPSVKHKNKSEAARKSNKSKPRRNFD